MDSILAFAEELELRDARVAQALVESEQLQREVDELRAQAFSAAAFLVFFPGALAERAEDERLAVEALDGAQKALADARAATDAARSDDERLARARVVEESAFELRVAERRLEGARDAVMQLEREGDERRREVVRLEAAASELAARLRGVEAPPPGLDGVIDWASRARGALLLEHSALAGERETLVREASELLGSALGEPLTSTAVAGVRERLERALRQG